MFASKIHGENSIEGQIHLTLGLGVHDRGQQNGHRRQTCITLVCLESADIWSPTYLCFLLKFMRKSLGGGQIHLGLGLHEFRKQNVHCPWILCVLLSACLGGC